MPAVTDTCCRRDDQGWSSVPSALWLGPYGELAATGFDEVEAPAAREIENRLHHVAARIHDLGKRGLERVAEEDDKRAPGFGARRQLGPVEAAIEARAGEGDVIGAVVDERPPEHLFEEAPGGAEVPGRVLDVVDFFVSRHSGLRPWQKIGGAVP